MPRLQKEDGHVTTGGGSCSCRAVAGGAGVYRARVAFRASAFVSLRSRACCITPSLDLTLLRSPPLTPFPRPQAKYAALRDATMQREVDRWEKEDLRRPAGARGSAAEPACVLLLCESAIVVQTNGPGAAHPRRMELTASYVSARAAQARRP